VDRHTRRRRPNDVRRERVRGARLLGTAQRETGSGEYGLALYYFVIPDKPQEFLLMYRQAARTGTVTVDGKVHKRNDA
jgi:hypothetical protein